LVGNQIEGEARLSLDEKAALGLIGTRIGRVPRPTLRRIVLEGRFNL
jgi:hypothetical protein